MLSWYNGFGSMKTNGFVFQRSYEVLPSHGEIVHLLCLIKYYVELYREYTLAETSGVYLFNEDYTFWQMILFKCDYNWSMCLILKDQE